jgi:hypothetical protein
LSTIFLLFVSRTSSSLKRRKYQVAAGQELVREFAGQTRKLVAEMKALQEPATTAISEG